MIDKELLKQKQKELFQKIDGILDSDDHDAKMKCIELMLNCAFSKKDLNSKCDVFVTEGSVKTKCGRKAIVNLGGYNCCFECYDIIMNKWEYRDWKTLKLRFFND